MRQLLLLLLYLNVALTYSQNESNIWYFGEKAGLDFNSGTPVPLTDGELSTLEGCATISDSNGNLLMYTDGVNVWDNNHAIMPNGTGLNGHPSSTHSAIIIPKPNSSNIYFIFTVDIIGFTTHGLQYTEVDMSLNNGHGDVTTNKNIPLSSSVSEKISAVENPSNGGYWLLSHKFNSDEFIAFEVTSSGVNSDPIISAVGSYIDSPSETIGQMKISPNGSKVAVVRRGEVEEVQLFDFNAFTGQVSNPMTLFSSQTEILLYGLEFSPNSQLLYVSALSGLIMQFNLNEGTASDISDSRILLSNEIGIGFSAIQLAPDGKLYISKSSGYLDVINSPNTLGLDCDYIVDGLYLDGRESRLGLPPFIQSYFNGFKFENTCLGSITQFYANFYEEYDSILWDFGDGNFSNEENPLHSYALAGDYWVSVTITIDSESYISTKKVTIYSIPDVLLSSVEFIECEEEANNGINLNDLNTMISSNYQQEVITYFSTELDAYNGENAIYNLITENNGAVRTQTLWARVENVKNSECFVIVSFSLVIYPKPILLMDDEVALCNLNSVTLVADEGYDIYYWSTGESTQEITVYEPGSYAITVSNIYDDLICSTEKTINVLESTAPVITEIETIDWSHNNNSIVVFVEGTGDYEYSLNGEIYQNENTFSGLLATEYMVYVRDKYGCGISVDKVYLLNYPKFFTPNNDGKNDFWKIKSTDLEDELSKLYIYDRYGKLIAELNMFDNGWDGTYNGNKLPANDYWFVLERHNGKTYTGHFALKR